MADEDILNDLEDEFEDGMEDILDDALLDDLDPDDLSDLKKQASERDDPFEVPDDASSSRKTNPLKKIVTPITDRIPERLRTRKVMMIAGSVPLLIILAAVLIMVFTGEDDGPRDAAQTDTGQVAEIPSSEAVLMSENGSQFEDIVALEPFVRTRLKTSSTMGQISLSISLELTDQRYRKQIYSFEERIRQMVISQLAEMTWLELRNPEGKLRLKYDLLKRINSLFPQPTVRNIYYTYFIMQ